jgi:hypothetical protein
MRVRLLFVLDWQDPVEKQTEREPNRGRYRKGSWYDMDPHSARRATDVGAVRKIQSDPDCKCLILSDDGTLVRRAKVTCAKHPGAEWPRASEEED